MMMVLILLFKLCAGTKDIRKKLYSSTCDRNSNWNYRNVSGAIKEWMISIKVVGLGIEL